MESLFPEKEVKSGSACECGQSLPWHLFELGLGLTHHCSCARAYVQSLPGTEVRMVTNLPNPFTGRSLR